MTRRLAVIMLGLIFLSGSLGGSTLRRSQHLPMRPQSELHN